MTYDFSFEVAHDYSDAIAIRVPVTLRSGKDETTFNAYVDTGSSFCVFRRGQAEVLGIDVESGNLLRIDTVTGGFDAWLEQKRPRRSFVWRRAKAIRSRPALPICLARAGPPTKRPMK